MSHEHQLKTLEAVHAADVRGVTYVEKLRELRAASNEAIMAICRAWHGETFAWPGYGDAAWVAGQIEKARKALLAGVDTAAPTQETMPIEFYAGIRYGEVTIDEKAAIDRIKYSVQLLTIAERNGSLADIITDLSVVIAIELRRAAKKKSDEIYSKLGQGLQEDHLDGE